MTARHGHLPRALLVAADAAAAVAACGLAYLLRIEFAVLPVPGHVDVLPARYLAALPVAAGVFVAASALAGLHGRGNLGRAPSFASVLRACGLAFVLLSTAALLYWREFQYS